ALLRERSGLVLHPVVQPPPLLDHDHGRERALALRRREEARDRLLAALVGHVLVGRHRRKAERRERYRQEESLHGWTSSPSISWGPAPGSPDRRASPRWPRDRTYLREAPRVPTPRGTSGSRRAPPDRASSRRPAARGP